jgi:hypothetical protein
VCDASTRLSVPLPPVHNTVSQAWSKKWCEEQRCRTRAAVGRRWRSLTTRQGVVSDKELYKPGITKNDASSLTTKIETIEMTVMYLVWGSAII